MSHDFRAGFVAFIGAPNVGKSSLMNRLIGEKVSIVSTKPQTTRQRIHGIWNEESFQAIIVDTPGMIRAEQGLNHFLEQELEACLGDVDALVWVVSLESQQSRWHDELKALIESQKDRPLLVVVNKMDLRPPMEKFGSFLQWLKENQIDFVAGSVREKSEVLVAEIRDKIKGLLPPSPAPLYPVELFTTESLRKLVGEIVREKCFLNLKHELPYHVAVRIRQFDESDEQITRIEADIVVSRHSHKAMVIGHKGQSIKNIGQQARQEIEQLLGKKVFLGLHVAHREKWMLNPAIMKDLGYVAQT